MEIDQVLDGDIEQNRKRKNIQRAEKFIFIVQFLCVSYVGLLIYTIEDCDYGNQGRNPFLYSSIVTFILSIPFIYTCLRKKVSKKGLGRKVTFLFNRLTLILGFFLIPFLVGIVYIYYSNSMRIN